MEVFTSYFYKVRFFTPNMLPFSTAVWDPKWYHEFRDQNHLFLDKRGVLNGLRHPAFAPGSMCEGLCRGRDGCIDPNPSTCDFLKVYRRQLDEIDYTAVMKYFEEMAEWIRGVTHYKGEPVIVLLVHEAPTNPCSERAVIQQWFASHGHIVEQWRS